MSPSDSPLPAAAPHSPLAAIVASKGSVLTNGGVMARIMARPDIELDPNVLHATAVFDDRARPLLAEVYASYAEVAVRHDLPMMCSTPTLRANAQRVPLAPYGDVRAVNHACVAFLHETLSRFDGWRQRFHVAGSIGPCGDTYRPETALPTDEAVRFHAAQAEALAGAGVDILVAFTLPALVEGLGMAKAFSAVGCPYALSFVLDRDGRILDGTPLARAIETIDDATDPPPAFYLANCAHTSAIRAGLERVARDAPHVMERIAGARPNASARDPRELDGLDAIETESPQAFASALDDLRRDWNLKVLGGCCGTDETHLDTLAGRLRRA